MDTPHVINIQTLFYGECMQDLAAKFKNPQSRGKFIKLRQIHLSHTLYRLVYDYLRVAKVTNDNLDC